jgi:hypothetical protein
VHEALLQPCIDDGKLGRQRVVVEPNQQLAGRDVVLVAHQNLLDGAAFLMLDLLGAALDHEGAGQHDRSGDHRMRGPDAEAAEDHDPGEKRRRRRRRRLDWNWARRER